ncbi:MAG: hypothetical protein M5R36_28500 [Deltaproteobacteria bacterium]|nr:hypothetical protein [Deltaproteobacteria bacterium]
MCAAAKRAGIDPVFTRGDNNDLFGAADFGILCSGTATLEAALAGLPMVIVYRGHPLNIFIAKRMVNIDRIGLPNIILGGETPTFPELIQRDADAASLADRVITILSAPGECDRLRDACREVKARLAGGRTSEAVAEEALRLAARE